MLFKTKKNIFCFLFSIRKSKSLSCARFEKKCLSLEKYLEHDNLFDLDGLDYFQN